MKALSTTTRLLAATFFASAFLLGCSGNADATGDGAEDRGTSTEQGLKDTAINQLLLGAQDHDARAWQVVTCRQKNPSSIKTPFTISFYGSSGTHGLPPRFIVIQSPSSPWSNAVISDFDSAKTLDNGRGGQQQFDVVFTTPGIGTFEIEALDGNAKVTTPKGTVDLTCTDP